MLSVVALPVAVHGVAPPGVGLPGPGHITDASSFEIVKIIYEKIHSYAVDLVLVLVGNKTDLDHQRQVSHEEPAPAPRRPRDTATSNPNHPIDGTRTMYGRLPGSCVCLCM